MSGIVVHSYHPDIHVNGLQDVCQRCRQHAENPQAMSAGMLHVLTVRMERGLPGRSTNERLAMANLERVRARQGQSI